MSDTEATKRPIEGESNGSSANGDAKKAKIEEPKGIVLFSGATDFADIGRKGTSTMPRSPNTIWKPVKLAALQDVDIVKVISGPTSCHIVALSRDGKVYTWGRNEKGQLGLGHAKDKKCPSLVKGMESRNVVDAATGKNHTLLLTDDGEIFACGDNKAGQCVGGANQPTVTTPKLIPYDGPPASRIACGGEFSTFVDIDGNVWSWGHPENGQLGHNTEGSFLEKAGKVNFDYVYNPTKIVLFVEKEPKAKAANPVLGVRIKEISCGSNHCVAVDDKNKAFSWGFGGYGRLGHSETGNELVPRLIKFFDGPRRGITKIRCGGQFTLAVAEIPGTTYMWGQYNTSKEANMYPKPIQDLSGWMNVCSIGCSSKGWIVSVDETVIAAIPSPCFGELGMGEHKKSSANPVEVKTLTDIPISSLTMGLAFSVYVTKPISEKTKAKLESLKVLDQSDQD